MKKSLSWRFVIIIGITLMAAWLVRLIPPRLGIDLAGGTSLLYELDLNKVKGDTSDLAERVVTVLKKRVDPYGQKNLIWRVVGGKRIQIQMPLADAKTRAAQKELQDSLDALRGTSIKDSQIQSALSRTGADREAEINKLAPPGNPRHDLLLTLAAAYDERQAAQAEEQKYDPLKEPPNVLERVIKAVDAYNSAKNAVLATNVDMAKLQNLLTATNNPHNKDARAELEKMPADYPLQAAGIKRVIAAHDDLAQSGGGVNDPSELQHLVTAAGVLDFRITVDQSVLGGPAGREYQDAVMSLQQKGPQTAITETGIHMRWFQIDPNGVDNFIDSRTKLPYDRFVISDWAGQKYLLMYDTAADTLTHDPTKKEWSVAAGEPYSDPQNGGIVLPFQMDPVGAGYMGDLTKHHVAKPMGILLDEKAFTAPNISTEIDGNGVITFGQPGTTRTADMILKEANDLKQIMDAGSLPATLQREPISVVEITPDLGADNIKAGINSAFYALIAVIGFMMVYYTITGVFADLALMINLLLVMAAMALLGGTFTLPGIAGLVLTLGMAVDANVLINERIREELHKGASLWMAVKQGYDKVFWTIFDANLTTSLTSIVLIYVGSEEVKGFGVTLLIGLCIHMFTALFATRTLMMAAIKWGIIRAVDDHSITEYLREIFTFTWIRNGHWPFMKVITVSNIDWIGKRKIFWGVSAITIVAGLTAFVMRGEDKYDIEFRGGTQVSFQLKPGVNMTEDQVRQRVHKVGLIPGLEDAADARVYGVGKPEEHRFELQTTIADTSTVKRKDKFLDALAKEMSDVLDVTQRVSVQGGQTEPRNIDDLMVRQKLIVPVTRGTLDQTFSAAGVPGMPNRDTTNFLHGVAIQLNDIDPPQSVAKLTDRIKSAQQSSDPTLTNVPAREFKIIPIEAIDLDGKAVPADEDDKRPLVKAVYVSVDEAIPYQENSDTEAVWKDRVAATEWQVIRVALSSESLFKGVTSFDAVVAGEAKAQALVAIVLSLVLIVAYVWVRFGGIRYGLGAIFSLVHDAIVALAATVLSGLAYRYIFGGRPNFFLVSDFKINLTMIAAYLTVIGYSVNDTIVIFDRVRELRGKSHAPLTAKLVNDAINQCFGRTIWTTFTVFIVVLIMYVFGGEGIRGFSFAMLIGVFTGAYSTLAIASPMLLATGTADLKPRNLDDNIFIKKVDRVEAEEESEEEAERK
ncbi:MAG TPA: protein translocase subunit SecD [Phycisphaerae bacterium]|nr:protein translocase subunit SecD [Phycisphaerae bacterium]